MRRVVEFKVLVRVVVISIVRMAKRGSFTRKIMMTVVFSAYVN